MIDDCATLIALGVACDEVQAQTGTPISTEPSFAVETIEKARWAQLFQEGRLAESRAYLEQNLGKVSVSAKIALVSMIDHGIGGERNQQQAFELLEQIVKVTGDPAAKYNLGMSYVFGRGTEPSPERGTELIDAALREGFDPHRAYAFFVQGCCVQGVERFSETFKRLEIAARHGNATAKMIKAIYLTRLIAIPPCLSINCYAEARRLVNELRDGGNGRMADVVEIALRQTDPEPERPGELRRSRYATGLRKLLSKDEQNTEQYREEINKMNRETEARRQIEEEINKMSRETEIGRQYYRPSRPIRGR